MDRRSLVIMRTALLMPMLLLTTTGCTSVQGPKMLFSKEQDCDMVLGVDDCACHGHRKTCWRSWDQVCWQSQACPQYNYSEVPTIETPVHETPVHEAVPPVPEME